MELIGIGPVILFAVVAVILFVLVVLGLPRWGGPIGRGTVRGVQVLLLNVTVIALCSLLLNDQYVFYSSWSDLLGTRSGQVIEQHGGAPQGAITTKVRGRGLSSPAGSSADYRLPQPGRRLQTYSVPDATSGTSAPVLVYLPLGYDPTSSRTYPVILGLHGFPSSPRGFTHQNFLSSIDQLTWEHRLAASIVVIPTIDVPVGIDTECLNGPPGRPQTETWLAREIPDWALHHLRVRTERTSWATFGYSYGGWCAAMLTMRHPDVFGGAIVLSGYFRPDFDTGYDPYRHSQLRPFDLAGLARTAPPPVALWVFASRQDGLAYPSTQRFLASARRPLAVTATIVPVGGHRESVYQPYVPAALRWLGQSLPGFRP
jgi:pimeloyl-ACP methyl ester carboxylesterase